MLPKSWQQQSVFFSKCPWGCKNNWRLAEKHKQITFLNKGKVYEVFVKQVYQSDLYGFVEVEDYVFDEKKQVVVDPTEEKLKSEFTGVKRSFIPMQAIIRIDEVEKSGVCSWSKI